MISKKAKRYSLLAIGLFLVLTLSYEIFFGGGLWQDYTGTVRHAMNLKLLLYMWTKQGLPKVFDIHDNIGFPNDRTYFDYTNIIKVKSTIYHCRFGARADDLPPGILAISDQGIILWISDTYSNVVISPEKITLFSRPIK